MHLKASQRRESQAILQAWLRRIHQQGAHPPGGHVLVRLNELGAPQKDLFATVGLPMPTTAEVPAPAPAGGFPTAGA